MKQQRKPLRIKSISTSTKTKPQSNAVLDPIIAAENRELQRLEKLLGIKKKGKVNSSVKDKLNREFEEEGFGDDFGSFLFELDELTNGLPSNSTKTQEDSDMSGFEELESIDTDPEHQDSEVGDMSENEHAGDVEAEKSGDLFTYGASAGEDIYGRTITGVAKYVPPSKRNNATSESEQDVLIGRKINGLMNKLSETSKDFVIRGIKEMYDTNSHTITNQAIFRSFKGLIASTIQRQAVIIELFALIVAGLHFTVGTDISSFMVEQAFQEFQKHLLEFLQTCDTSLKMSSKKQAVNYITFLGFLYAFRVIHHKLIVDVILSFVKNNLTDLFDEENARKAVEGIADPVELRLELIETVLSICGDIVRSDDFESFTNIHMELTKQLRNRSNFQNSEESLSRVEFLLEVLTNLKSSAKQKSSPIATRIKSYRQWIGQAKQMIGNKVGDSILSFNLNDLVTMESRGKWWKLGATWKKDDTSHRNQTQQTALPESKDIHNEGIDKLAAQMKLNTGVRKSILSTLCTSRDVLDAFERLQKLELKGKLEREIIRVVIECCAREKVFNPFYAELLKLFCSSNRQIKITFQYALWDFIKSQRLKESISDKDNRMLINVARMLSELVVSFNVPLAILKIFEISDLDESSILFLSTFFVAVYKCPISDEDFQKLCDRVATSKDALALRDMILLFNQTYMKNIEKSFDHDTGSVIKRRKRVLTSTMKEMEVLKMNLNEKLIADDLD